MQLRSAQEHFRQARERLKIDLQETESALLRGVAPSQLALQPPMRVAPPMMAPAMGPSLGTGQVCTFLHSDYCLGLT